MRRADGAVSEITGTAMLLAVTLIVVGIAAAGILSQSTEPPLPRLDVMAEASPGDDSLRIVHVGGRDFDRGDVLAHVAVNDAEWYRGPIGNPGEEWSVGDEVDLDLGKPIPGGAHLDLTLYMDPRGTLDTTTLLVPGAGVLGGLPGPAPGPNFYVTIWFENGRAAITVMPPTDTVVHGEVFHPYGRKAVHTVTVDLSSLGASANSRMYDDGTHGDEVAGDGVYATIATVHQGSAGPRAVTVKALDVTNQTRTATGTIHVSNMKLVYNTTLIEAAAVRVIKQPTHSANGDDVTVHLKLRLVDHPIEIDGEDHEITRGWFTYERFQPGNNPSPIELARECYDASTRNMLLKAENETVDMWDSEEEVLYYFLGLDYEPTSGGGDTYETTVDSSRDDDYVVLTRHEDVQVIMDGDFPETFEDCSG